MSILRRFIKRNPFLKSSIYRFKWFFYRVLSLIQDDKSCIIKRYKKRTHKKLDLNNPRSFNEKIQWLKLYWFDPLATRCADKYGVREIVENRCDASILNQLYGVFDSVEQIDFAKLPEKFVLKATHASGFNILCYAKNSIDIKDTKRTMRFWLNNNYYHKSREWVYRDIKPRIICERLLMDSQGNLPRDYKFFCFDGQPYFIQIDIDRFGMHKRNIYDLDWNLINVEILFPSSPETIIEKPVHLGRMIEISRKLSNGFPHVRVDLYYIDEQIYFGELTFFHGSGYEPFSPESYNVSFGDLIDIRLLTEKRGPDGKVRSDGFSK